jgi:hypothetical protein
VIPYEWVNLRGDRVLGDWDLEGSQRRQLKALMLDLEKYDLRAAVNSIIFKTGVRDVYYSKINGTVALRPRCCIGPDLSPRERRDLAGRSAPPDGVVEIVTYLERVSKKDNKEHPLLKDTQASKRIVQVGTNRECRRRVVLHIESEEV